MEKNFKIHEIAERVAYAYLAPLNIECSSWYENAKTVLKSLDASDFVELIIETNSGYSFNPKCALILNITDLFHSEAEFENALLKALVPFLEEEFKEEHMQEVKLLAEPLK